MNLLHENTATRANCCADMDQLYELPLNSAGIVSFAARHAMRNDRKIARSPTYHAAVARQGHLLLIPDVFDNELG